MSTVTHRLSRISDDPTTAEATLRTYLSYWNSNGGTAVETAADTNKQAVDYKVLDAATQAQLQTDYPNTLQIQNGWAQFDIVSHASTIKLPPQSLDNADQRLTLRLRNVSRLKLHRLLDSSPTQELITKSNKPTTIRSIPPSNLKSTRSFNSLQITTMLNSAQPSRLGVMAKLFNKQRKYRTSFRTCLIPPTLSCVPLCVPLAFSLY